MPILIDTSALVALALTKDSYHTEAEIQLRLLEKEDILVVPPALVEFFYVTFSRLNDYSRCVRLLARMRASFNIEVLTEADMVRMESIMTQYASSRLDYTDAAIMAMAERLNIRRIFTLDRRDFAIFRPAHADFLELIP